MRKFILLPFIIGSLFILLLACDNKQNDTIYTRLLSWDALIDSIPQQISDSLKIINPENLSRSNRAYHALLTTVADDKNYVSFSNDSTITDARNYYETYDPENENYIRALVYQGIVRSRKGISDSTAFEPLKQAAHAFEERGCVNPSLGYLVYYFLGDIHYNNQNYHLANQYFNNTLKYAKTEKDSVHIFDAYLALYWNEMLQSNYELSKNYLDTLSGFYGKLPEKDFFVLNAKSVFFESNEDYKSALKQEQAMLSLEPAQLEKINKARIYYNISNLYKNIGQLDSAMLYGQISIDQIKDTTDRQNYVLYDNVADIAEQQLNYLIANKYRKRASSLYQQSVRDRLDTQIMELEKKYDLSEAENITLKSQQNLLYAIIAAFLLGFLLIFSVLFSLWRRRREKMKLLIARHEAETQAIQAKLLTEEANKRKWLMDLYGHISRRLSTLQDQFDTLSQRYVSSHPKIYQSMYDILHTAETEIREIPENLTPDAETFYNYTGINDTENLFNSNEKLLLMLLSCNADNKQIATFMNTSVESIRVRKSQLKKKMMAEGVDISCFN